MQELSGPRLPQAQSGMRFLVYLRCTDKCMSYDEFFGNSMFTVLASLFIDPSRFQLCWFRTFV